MRLFSHRHPEHGGDREVPRVSEPETARGDPDEPREPKQASDSFIQTVRNQPITLGLLVKLGGLLSVVILGGTTALTWWREREIAPLVRRIEAVGGRLDTFSAGLDTTNRLLRSKVDADDFMNYAVCQQFKRNVERGISDSYPAHCDSPAISRFEARTVRPNVRPPR